MDTAQSTRAVARPTSLWHHYGVDPDSGHLISLSFWDTAAAALAGAEAVRRIVRSLPAGTTPRPSKAETDAVEYRDLKGAFVK